MIPPGLPQGPLLSHWQQLLEQIKPLVNKESTMTTEDIVRYGKADPTRTAAQTIQEWQRIKTEHGLRAVLDVDFHHEVVRAVAATSDSPKQYRPIRKEPS